MDRYFTSTRRLPPLPADEIGARQAVRAALIGVPWPPDLKRKQGKLGHERAWTQKVQRHVLDDLDLLEWVKATKPTWWRTLQMFSTLSFHLRGAEVASGASTSIEKDTTTVTLAHTAPGEVFDLCATVLHKGKTAAVFPANRGKSMSDTTILRQHG
eukprot:5083046-Amphidinium_carterae.1